MLLGLIEEHRGAFEYDWRTRFHLALDDVPEVMGWGEACRMVDILCADPSSCVGAAVAGWDHPMSREGLVLMDLFDLQHFSKVEKAPDPYKRPWPDPNVKHRGRTNLPREAVIAILARFGHGTPPGRKRDARGRFVKQ